METQQSNPYPTTPSSTPQPPHNSGGQDHGRLFGGLVIVIIGSVWLARQLGVEIPYWLLRWEMLLIAFGIFIGARHSFRDPGWLVPVAIGSVLLLDNYYHVNLWRYFWPVFIIGIGMFMILRSRKKTAANFSHQWNRDGIDGNEEVLDSVTVFGGIKKNIISKSFRGGEAVTIFGGTEINLTQADSNDKINLELVQVFGGTKLIVPPHWKIHADEVVTIFGGLNDKRMIPAQPVADESKIIVLRGTCIFGGIDIKSF